MLKLWKDDGFIVVENRLNGKKLVIQEFEKGFRFNSKWWDKADAANMLTEVQQLLGPTI